MENQDMKENDGFIERLRESPRTVSALIIILIVAAAIYAFSGQEENKNQTGAVGETGAPAIAEGTAVQLEQSGAEQNLPNQPTADSEVSSEQKEDESEKMTVEARRTDKSFVEVAAVGNGVTHLARRAAGRWLAENQANYAVTDEHRIFIEDYIKDQTGSRGLSLGEEVEVSFDLIQAAVEAAGQLNERQLKNLSQYTSALT